MTDIHEAVREVLKVRDAERDDKASTEDLLDAIAGLEDAKYPPSYQGDLDEVLFTIDLAVSVLLPHASKPTQASNGIDRAIIGLKGALDTYCPESPAFTALRYKLREMDYDMLSPMWRDQPEYHFCVMSEEVAALKPFIEDLKKEHTVRVEEGVWEPAFTVTIRPAGDTDQHGFPLIDIIVKRTEHKAMSGVASAAA